jgi:hypothetical protein
MRNPKKTIYAWSLDKTKFFEFPSQREAAIELCSSQPNVSRAARSERIIQGKYVLSYNSIFPENIDHVHGKSVPVWVWDKDFQPIKKFASHQRAADALGISIYCVYEGVRVGSLVKGAYLFTKDETPPAKIGEKVKPVSPPKEPVFELFERKWVPLGEFEDTEAASNGSGLSTRQVHAMLKSGEPYKGITRASTKKKLIVMEKLEFVSVGKYITMTAIANAIGVLPHAVSQTMGKNGVIGGKYKVSRIMQPIETPTV